MELTTATTFDQGSRWRTGVASREYSGAAAGSERIGPRRGVAPSAFTAFGTLAVREAREVFGTERPVATTVEPHSGPAVVVSEPLDSASIEADELLELGDEIATLAAHIHAATYRLLTLIAEFDRRGGWKAGGHRTCAHWLAHRTGMALGPARERIRAARALERLPRISESMSRGELSFSKVRALTRTATPANESELLELAHAGTAAQLERVLRGWRRHDRLDEAELERERHRSRRFSVTPDADGMYIVRGRLDPEVGALLMRAIEAASDALYRTERSAKDGTAESPRTADVPRTPGISHAAPAVSEPASAILHGAPAIPNAAATRPGEQVVMSEEVAETVRSQIARRMVTEATREEEIKPGQRRADALGLLAERAMAAGFDADGNLSGTRAERYQVVVHVEPATLAEGDETTRDGRPDRTSAGSSRLAPMLSELEDGTRVSAETSRRLACDAGVVTIERDSDGSILDVGRKTRSVPPALRRALDARDRGCRFPGCGLRFTDAHHIRHWADGGATRLGNLVLLCRFHHRLVHEEGFRVEYPDFGHPTFYTPKGLPLPDAPRLPDIVDGSTSLDRANPADSIDPVEALVAQNRRRGIEPDYATARSTYKRDRDIPTSILFPAMEAAEGG